MFPVVLAESLELLTMMHAGSMHPLDELGSSLEHSIDLVVLEGGASS